MGQEMSHQENPTQDKEPAYTRQLEDDHQEKWMTDRKSTQLHCLFQMLVYTLHNGVKKMPLHTMLRHALYARDRSKSLITAFNRIGSCTSYNTVRAARSLLASYAVKCSEDGETLMPSTFTNINDIRLIGQKAFPWV